MPVNTKKSSVKSKSGKTSSKKTAVKKTPAKKTASKKKSAVKKTLTVKTATKKTALKSKPKKIKTQNKVSGKTVKKAVQKKSVVSKKTSNTKKKKVSSKQYTEVKKLLESRKEEILREVAGDLSSGLNSETTSYPDLSDLASIESDRNFKIRIKERERKLLKKINAALEQIKNGTFGICESCGEEIGTQRLLARPVATLCIQCKTEAERDEKARNI